MRRNLFYCPFLSLIVILVFWRITQTFYQQDEWLGYGLYLAHGASTIWQNTGGFLGAIMGRGRVLTNLLYFLFYQYFPLNTFPIAIFAIVFHATNSLLVFFLAKKIFKKILPAFFGSLFFAVSSVSQSAVTWPATAINTLPATTLILISLFYYFKFLETLKNKWLFFSSLLIYLSLFFKESGVFLFLLLPLASLLFKRYAFPKFVRTYWYWLLATALIVFFRIQEFKSATQDVALFLTGSSKYFFDSIIVRSFLYPLTSFSLSIIPPEPFLNFARYLTNVYYPFIPEGQFILVAQTAVLDLLAVLLSLFITLVSLGLLKITVPKLRKTVLFWFIFIPSTFFPYVIISKNFSYLESRYYYLAALGWAMIFTWVLSLLLEGRRFKFWKIFLLGIFLLFLYVHAETVIGDINKLVEVSQTRVRILDQIKTLKPTLGGNKNIFYIVGDTDYHSEGNKLPFQNGAGYVLMSLYYSSGKVPKELLADGFLFEIGSQGYQEVGNLGFGYFSDIQKLKDATQEKKFSVSSIISLRYDGASQTLSKMQPF